MGNIKLERHTCSPHDMKSFSYPSVKACASASDNYLKNVETLEALLHKIDCLIAIYKDCFKTEKENPLFETMETIKKELKENVVDLVEISEEEINLMKKSIKSERDTIFDLNTMQAQREHNNIAVGQIYDAKLEDGE